MINFRNWKDLESFTKDNIAEFNEKPKAFSRKKLIEASGEKENYFTSTNIAPYLHDKYIELISNKSSTKFKEFSSSLNTIDQKNIPDIKAELLEIANSFVLNIKDVEFHYKISLLQKIQTDYLDKIVKSTNKRITEYAEKIGTKSQAHYCANNFKKLVEKSLYVGFSGGFTRNLTGINEGTKTANEGDSAQFLFLARAILSGFICSNIDVRSSRYDAVIDYNGTLLKVQVKGISQGSISLKDRDRGGEGIDTSSPRNKGKFITTDDCDLYVAVDKQFGICYLIPTTEIEKWSDKSTTKSLSSLSEYKENWDIIQLVEKEKSEKASS